MGGDNTSEGRFARATTSSTRSTRRHMRLIAFLDNLVLFKIEEEEAAAAAASPLVCCRRPGPRQRVKIAPKGFRIRVQ